MVKRNNYDGGGSNKRRKSNDGRGLRLRKDTAPSDCTVFVGNLKYETRWQALKDHMRRAGNVDSANILEAPNGRSKGCALVTYQHPKEAQRAIAELNESELEGRTIFVQPDKKPGDGGGDARNNGNNNHNDVYSVFVGNLPYECSWQALKDYFKSCGYIERAEVMEDPKTGRKKGFGTITFSNERGMDNAIRNFNGRDFQGRSLEVRPDKKASMATNNNNNSQPEYKVFFGNLDFDCSWQQLKDFVQQRCGGVEHVDIPKKGWGVATFATKRGAEKAIAACDNVMFQSRNIDVRWDRDSSTNNKNSSNTQLFVGNLPYDCTWQQLKDAFKRFGAVSHAEVCETQNGKTTGFGIVAFVKSHAAEKALSSMDGVDFQGRKLSVRWDRKPEKLESEKAAPSNKRDNNKKAKQAAPKKKAQPKQDESMQEDEPKGDPLDMALSAPR